MRVAFVSEDPDLRAGIPRYSVPVAEQLAGRGLTVDYVFTGGLTARYDWRMRRRWTYEQRGAVTFHGLLNSDSVGFHFGAPELDVHNADTAYLVGRVAALAPDVVHVHSLAGVPAEALVGFARRAPVILSVHDFGLVCQRRVLVHADGRLCRTYASQLECPLDVAPVDVRRYRLRGRLANTPGGVGLKAVRAVSKTMGRPMSAWSPPATGTPDPEAARPYVRRLEQMVAIVNEHVSQVLAVSHSVRDVLVECGVRPELVEVSHIGSGSADRLAPMPLPCAGGAPPRFIYLGGLVPNKGAHVVSEALARMDDPPEVTFTGSGYPEYERGLRAQAPPNAAFSGRYDDAGLRDLLAAHDVAIVPPVGPDTSPQVVFEALAAGRPVIGSRIGGIPDFVRDGVNGRLFDPGDAAQLAALLDDLRSPARVLDLAREAKVPRTVAQHVDELAGRYERVSGAGDSTVAA